MRIYFGHGMIFLCDKISRKEGMHLCVCERKVGTLFLCVILSYFVFSFYLNLIQIKKEIVSKKKGVGPTFCVIKNQENLWVCTKIKKDFSSYRMRSSQCLFFLLPSPTRPKIYGDLI